MSELSSMTLWPTVTVYCVGMVGIHDAMHTGQDMCSDRYPKIPRLWRNPVWLRTVSPTPA
jgi:hypothetical protein